MPRKCEDGPAYSEKVKRILIIELKHLSTEEAMYILKAKPGVWGGVNLNEWLLIKDLSKGYIFNILSDFDEIQCIKSA